MIRMKKVFSLLLATLMCLALFAGCTGGEKPAAKDKLVMATNAEFPPYEFMDGSKIVGIDAEIMQAIAEDLGMELVIENMEFESVLAAVSSGKADIGAAGLTIRPDRLESVDFTDTYAKAKQVVIVRDDGQINSLDDIELGMKIGVQAGTTGWIYASDTPENGGYGEENVESYSKGFEAVQALSQGKVSAVIIDNEPAKVFVSQQSGLKILDDAFADEEYAIAVRKGNTELLDKVNASLRKLKENGKFQEIVDKYITAE